MIVLLMVKEISASYLTPIKPRNCILIQSFREILPVLKSQEEVSFRYNLTNRMYLDNISLLFIPLQPNLVYLIRCNAVPSLWATSKWRHSMETKHKQLIIVWLFYLTKQVTSNSKVLQMIKILAHQTTKPSISWGLFFKPWTAITKCSTPLPMESGIIIFGSGISSYNLLSTQMCLANSYTTPTFMPDNFVTSWWWIN